MRVICEERVVDGRVNVTLHSEEPDRCPGALAKAIEEHIRAVHEAFAAPYFVGQAQTLTDGFVVAAKAAGDLVRDKDGWRYERSRPHL